ncbi:MAG TPA: outer membrane beta-barrel protein [Bacteroidia bacterium]|jgi:hypothetical protein|nr:outer membrane beta-barrel protein [Bacteroidia bacterium]
MKTRSNYFFVLLTVLAFAISVKAQIFSGGIVGGVSTSAVKIENVGNSFSGVLHGNNIYGFEAGAFAKLMLSPFYIKPMGLYNFSMGEIRNDNGATSSQTNNYSTHRIEAPVLLGLKIIGPLSIEAGPVYNYIIQSASRFNDNDVTISQVSGIGYRAGIALEISRLLINLSYSGVTINSNGMNSASFKEPYKLVFGLGIKLGKIE